DEALQLAAVFLHQLAKQAVVCLVYGLHASGPDGGVAIGFGDGGHVPGLMGILCAQHITIRNNRRCVCVCVTVILARPSAGHDRVVLARGQPRRMSRSQARAVSAATRVCPAAAAWSKRRCLASSMRWRSAASILLGSMPSARQVLAKPCPAALAENSSRVAKSTPDMAWLDVCAMSSARETTREDSGLPGLGSSPSSRATAIAMPWP